MLGVAAPAAQAGIDFRQRGTGTVTITWRGDPARGCEEAGVCGIVGSAHLGEPNSVAGTIEGDGLDDRFVLWTLDLGDVPATLRVLRGPLEAPFGACTDTVRAAAIRLVPTRLPGGRVRIDPLLRPERGPGFLAGRCAGPLGVDVGALLPSVTVSNRRLRQGRIKMDFRGRGSFTSGPFSGEVVSTLVVHRRARRAPSRTRRGEAGVSARARSADHRRGVVLELDLSVVGATGALATDFTGAAAPLCEALDACGMRGTHELAARPLTGAARTFELAAYGTPNALGGRRPTVAAALEALAAGRLDPLITEGPALPATSSATVTWPEGPPCRDTRVAALPALRVGLGRMASFRLEERAGPFGAVDDPFRTRCPGPAASDITRRHLVAAGSVPFAQLAEPRFSVRLAAPAPRPDDDFAVATRGEIVLDLERTRVRLRGGR